MQISLTCVLKFQLTTAYPRIHSKVNTWSMNMKWTGILQFSRESCSDFNVVLFFYRPAAASKVAHPSRIMSVLLLGALGHQCDIKSTKNLNNKIIDILALC